VTFLKNAAKWYKSEPHQDAAWQLLESQLPEYLLREFQDAYRGLQAPPEPSFDNTWDGIYLAAKANGAKFPECVAAQWALESAWGTALSGKNNYFGIKGSGTVKSTQEHYGKGYVTIKAEFKDFESPEACVRELIKHWYKDYKNYKGVNRASSYKECCNLLKTEGYATDPYYPQKLIKIINRQCQNT